MAAYSPERRTALVFCGSGVHGAYHAGVLRALQEAGVKIDILAGQGIGAGTAALAAIDGASRLWESDGVWLSPHVARLYRWQWPLRWAAWVALAVLVVLLTPVFVLATGLLVYPVGFLLEMARADAGAALMGSYSAWLQRVFASESLPTIVPRIAMVGLGVAVGVIAWGSLSARWRSPVRRRTRDAWWWGLLGAPLESTTVRAVFAGAIEQLMRGVVATEPSKTHTLGRRYADMLTDNLGQPGFRELVLVATDLDARRDLVAALLREPFRREFLAPRPGRERQSEVLDLSDAGRNHALELVAAGLTPPFVCDPQPINFAPDSFWRGETHRLCDRPSSVSRLLEEVAAAGASQAILVSAVAPNPKPHHLSAPSLGLRARLGEHLAATASASLRDAETVARLRFDSMYLIYPSHNPLGPFDVAGAYDQSSDRRQNVRELMDRAYEDAYLQFIEPVVGASGEHLARRASAGHADGHESLFDDADSPR